MAFDARQYLADRLLSQFRQSPHINSILDILAEPHQDRADVCQYILDNTDLDTAEGTILDMYGEMIGVVRPTAQETKLFTLFDQYDMPDDHDNQHGFYNPIDGSGGYMSSKTGTPADDGSYMSDDDYRQLILSKAKTYRQKATSQQVFDYLLEFGARCIVERDDKLSVEITQVTYDDFNHWQRNYVLTKGFLPAGINISIRDNIDKETL